VLQTVFFFAEAFRSFASQLY